MRTQPSHFQYPQSDRALCNFRLHPDEPPQLPLSVSPIGSSPLQPVQQSEPGFRGVTFSIPNRIEPSATDRGSLIQPMSEILSVSPIGSSPLQLVPLPEPCVPAWKAFSIPNRIEPSATYCQLDSSASCVPTFSIPNRIEPSATFGLPCYCAAGRGLSVSPIGSSPLQQYDVICFEDLNVNFQYPQSDRALCNSLRHLWPFPNLRLSVSPIGSSPLQLFNRQASHSNIPAFSIPNRIEPSATSTPPSDQSWYH